jgi:signal transduction histidine kinase
MNNTVKLSNNSDDTDMGWNTKMKHKLISHQDMGVMAFIFIFIIIIAAFVARYAIQQYRENLAKNSAQQMIEYGDQIVSSLNAQTTDNWKKTQAVGYMIETSKYNTAENLLTPLQQLAELWDLKNIILYTDSGVCYTEDGKTVSIDSASEQAYQARLAGKYEVIVGSQIYYIVPVDIDLTLRGSKITAVAIVKDLGGIIGSMNLTSYNQTAKIYYTQLNGLVISKTENGESHLNIESAYRTGTLVRLIGPYDSVSEALRDNKTCALLYKTGEKSSYVIILPVGIENQNFNLLIDAPASVVDQSMITYSTFLSVLYVVVFAIVAAAFLLLFYYFYRQRLKSIREVLARERMLNLLVSNTNEVFTMFSLKQAEPVFVSQNQKAVTGSGSKRILHIMQNGRPQFSFEKSGDEEYLKELNRELAEWDGTGIFTSDYLKANVDGEIKYLEARLYYTKQQDAEIILTTMDVTKEFEREETLRAALDMADDASKAKTAFLSNMSHDIRTPMNAIVNMTDFALQSKDDPVQLTQYLNTIKDSSNHLLKLINDILDMSRIESGKMEVEIEPFDVSEQMRQVVAIIEPLCRKKDQQFTYNADLIHKTLKGDPLKIRQIMINLLNNAVKFTPEGGKIRLEITEENGLTDRHDILRIVVRDNGIGMNAEEIQLIFEPFRRLQNAQIHRAEGSGLGLSICRSFAKAMGGSISVESSPGKGSVFTVLLPFEAAEWSSQVPAEANESEKKPAAADFTGKCALVCEDNEINCQIACLLLESMGFKVDTAGNGKEGFQKFLASRPGTYDVIFMDIQMPEMNGYDATTAIRASNHEQAKSIPIIAMTANVFKEDVEHAREAGMNGHIGKPLNKDAIIRVTMESTDFGKGEEKQV